MDSESSKAKKLINVKELVNLFIAEHVKDKLDLKTSLNRLNIGLFRLLSNYLLFKMKTSDTFSMLIEKEVFDDINEFQSKSLKEFDISKTPPREKDMSSISQLENTMMTN